MSEHCPCFHYSDYLTVNAFVVVGLGQRRLDYGGTTVASTAAPGPKQQWLSWYHCRYLFAIAIHAATICAVAIVEFDVNATITSVVDAAQSTAF